MEFMLMLMGIFGVFLSIWLENTKTTQNCRTLWDVHRTYMWHTIAILTLFASLVTYFIGLNLAG